MPVLPLEEGQYYGGTVTLNLFNTAAYFSLYHRIGLKLASYYTPAKSSNKALQSCIPTIKVTKPLDLLHYLIKTIATL